MEPYKLHPKDPDFENLLRVSGPLAEERLRSIVLQRMLDEVLAELELFHEMVKEELPEPAEPEELAEPDEPPDEELDG